ncbi:MAG: fold-4 domain protein [Gemmatimonadetes bacterium]|nr:fold-4 domain protein [Gemmatimonadota bacterium]
MSPVGEGGSGVIALDRTLVVRSWDAWIARVTGIPAVAAIGRPLEELYPELRLRGMIERLQRVADGGGIEVLSPAFHKFLIPCAPQQAGSAFDRMRQHVVIAPVHGTEGVARITLTIEDVTPRLDRERMLVAQLEDGDESARMRAAQSLASMDAAPSLLADALADASWRVRRVAAESVGRTSGSEAVEMLIEAIEERHRDPALLNSALTALTHTISDPVPALCELLEIADVDVRTYSALALGMIASPAAVPALLRRLDDPDQNVRYHAIEALGRIGDRSAADAIASIAETRDFFLAFPALDALALIGETSVAPRLVPLLEDPMLISAVAPCIGELGSEDVAVPLAAMIGRPGVPVGLIALALAAVHDRLQSAFGEGALVRDLATQAMDASAVDAMVLALPDADEGERRGILTVLGWCPAPGVNVALAQHLSQAPLRETVAQALTGRGVPATEAVMDAARDGDDDTRRIAANVLGRIGDARAVPLLVSMLDEEPDTIITACGALGAIGDRAGYLPLLEVLDHHDASVRQAAVSALNSIGHPDMEQAVVARLDDPSPRVRESAVRVAGYFGYASALPRLLALCEDGDEMGRRASVEHLGNFEDEAAWDTIRRVLATDGSAGVRSAAARALGEPMSGNVDEALYAAGRDPNFWVRYYAARGLGRQPAITEDARTLLTSLALSDPAPPVRIAALEALAAQHAVRSIETFLQLHADSEEEVAIAAITALGRIEGGAGVAIATHSLVGELLRGDPARTVAAVRSLGSLRAPDAVTQLGALARSGRAIDTRIVAVMALAEIGTRAAVMQLVELASVAILRRDVARALTQLREDAVQWLASGLTNPDVGTRCVVVEALSRMRHPGATRLLATVLDDPSSAVRHAASQALSRLDLR